METVDSFFDTLDDISVDVYSAYHDLINLMENTSFKHTVHEERFDKAKQYLNAALMIISYYTLYKRIDPFDVLYERTDESSCPNV